MHESDLATFPRVTSDAVRSNLYAWLTRFDLQLDEGAIPSLDCLAYGQNLLTLTKRPLQKFNQSAHLSIGLAGDSFENPVASREIFWAPKGFPFGESICVASSRLGKKLDAHDGWFDALRTIASNLNPDKHFFVTSAGTTTDSFIRRIAELFGFDLVDFQKFPDDLDADWFESGQTKSKTSPIKSGVFPCYYDSLTGPSKRMSSPKSEIAKDELLICVANETRLLSVRKNGNIYRAAKRRLAESPQPVTKLLVDSRLTSRVVREELVALNATSWWLYSDSVSAHTPQESTAIGPRFFSDSAVASDLPIPILELSEIKMDRYLIHWTRRRLGPWPDQTEDEYLDDLIFRAPRRQHDDLATLARILAGQTILATNRLTRSLHRVVCFSNLPLDKILDRKIFRPHLSRWDFQPYGIAIERDKLAQLGAQPVIYGDEGVWEALPDELQPFFQPATSKSKGIDWRTEKEWRMVGDLNLRRIESDAAVVFVRTAEEAKLIAPISRWPVVTLETPLKRSRK